MAKKAISVAPKNADYLDTLGWIQSRMGDLEEALSTFREALVYDYGNPSVKYHLSSTLVQLDRKAEAGRLLGEIKSSSRPFADMAKVNALLNKIGN